MRKIFFLTFLAAFTVLPTGAAYSNGQYAVMRQSTQLVISKQLTPAEMTAYLSEEEKSVWLGSLLDKFPPTLPTSMRPKIATLLLYEAKRSGLDPWLVLAVIDGESNFRKYAISSAGALGLMQIMPSVWLDSLGAKGHNLFDEHTNIRFGCLILRHYLDMEGGNVSRALARYNGSLGSDKYPNYIFARLKKWKKVVN